MSTLSRLVAARRLIADPACWIKGESFRVVEGRKCYCALGALDATKAGRSAWLALRAHLQPHRSIAVFNDDPATTHADVLALYDRAIETHGGGERGGVGHQTDPDRVPAGAHRGG